LIFGRDGFSFNPQAASERFKSISDAYEVLSDAELRKGYDRTGRVPDAKARNERASSR